MSRITGGIISGGNGSETEQTSGLPDVMHNARVCSSACVASPKQKVVPCTSLQAHLVFDPIVRIAQPSTMRSLSLFNKCTVSVVPKPGVVNNQGIFLLLRSFFLY